MDNGIVLLQSPRNSRTPKSVPPTRKKSFVYSEYTIPNGPMVKKQAMNGSVHKPLAITDREATTFEATNEAFRNFKSEKSFRLTTAKSRKAPSTIAPNERAPVVPSFKSTIGENGARRVKLPAANSERAVKTPTVKSARKPPVPRFTRSRTVAKVGPLSLTRRASAAPPSKTKPIERSKTVTLGSSLPNSKILT